MRQLVPSCHVGVLSTFERASLAKTFNALFCGTRDRFFIAPLCEACHHRFTSLNEEAFEDRPAFEIL